MHYIDSDYTKMIQTDECIFKGDKQICRKWCPVEEKYKISAMKTTQKLNVWVAIY